MKKKTWKFVFLTVLAAAAPVGETDGKQTLTEVQIETKDGPLYRVLAIDGTALNPTSAAGRRTHWPAYERSESLLKLKTSAGRRRGSSSRSYELDAGGFCLRL